MTDSGGASSLPSNHARKLPVRFIDRHPIAVALAAAVLLSGLWPVPPVVDAVTRAAPAGALELRLPLGYVLLAPPSNTLDALTFLSVGRAKALVVTWLVVLAAWGALRPGTWRRRLGRALLWPFLFVALAAAAVLLPRPVPRLVVASGSGAILDYHVHSAASHDGRKGRTPDAVARWHARQGFTATYLTDHNVVFPGATDTPIPLLPGVEWSLFRLHLVAIGPVEPLDRPRYSDDLDGLLTVFNELHRQGALGIASLPEYWRYHREDLERFAIAGVDGFEIVNCAPKAIGFTPAARADVVGLARRYDRLVVGVSDNHGWGMTTCVWNVTVPGQQGIRANRVIARPLALAQGSLPAWHAAVSQPWMMLRSLTWAERISWLVWIALVTTYRAVPRRHGQSGGVGILARSLAPPPPAS